MIVGIAATGLVTTTTTAYAQDFGNKEAGGQGEEHRDFANPARQVNEGTPGNSDPGEGESALGFDEFNSQGCGSGQSGSFKSQSGQAFINSGEACRN